ncbi:hypothetical protein [Actinokineospora fastidiosa]|uniref:Uncharacterized protein n=1 Tax=Actinokineospora fastidiosa TaxID=1816 RepID=A0A918GC92_9PSEU|nr:hypothetical protein [Actinokineospora fastidiosa]GGS28748.1 hypothetical protein GCM10010171_22350 [Actinokineospora fastidiosa]
MATTPAASAPSGSAAAAPLTGEQADELATDLISGDEARVREAVAVSPEQPLEPGLAPSLASAVIEVDASTFQPQPDGSAVVAARVDGKRWTIRLVAVEGRWLISSTEAAQ